MSTRPAPGTPGIVLVTGAGRGIGRATALRLAHAGWHVFAGVRTDLAGEQLVIDAGALSGRVTPVELDVTVPAHLEALLETLPERLDALVNNVGIAVAGPLETLSRADLQRQFDVNVTGPMTLTSALLPRLRRSPRGGRVVVISSVNGRVSFPFTGAYNASKYALEALADCLRVELHPFGVQVTLVEPGVVDTDPWHEMDALIDDLEAGLPTELRTLYAQHFAGERQLVATIRRNAQPPDRVAAAVERALTLRRMRPRTLVGKDARAIVAMRTLLPARGLDTVWRRGLGVSAYGTSDR